MTRRVARFSDRDRVALRHLAPGDRFIWRGSKWTVYVHGDQWMSARMLRSWYDPELGPLACAEAIPFGEPGGPSPHTRVHVTRRSGIALRARRG